MGSVRSPLSDGDPGFRMRPDSVVVCVCVCAFSLAVFRRAACRAKTGGDWDLTRNVVLPPLSFHFLLLVDVKLRVPAGAHTPWAVQP